MTWSRKINIEVAGIQQGTIFYRQTSNGFNAEINLTHNVIGRKIRKNNTIEDDFELKIVNKKITAQSSTELDKLIDVYLKTFFEGEIILVPKLA